MPASKKASSKKTVKSAAATAGAHIDVIFVGPLLFVPEVSAGTIVGVEVYSPSNGHPVGALFLPGVLFSDAELDDPKCKRWPEIERFSLLDPHSYAIKLTQSTGKMTSPFPVSGIPDTNHKVQPARKLSAAWEVAISIHGQLSGWTSHRLMDVIDGFYHGGDAPTAGRMSGLHRLTYRDVSAIDLCGASSEARDYLQANGAKGGTLAIVGEIPYQSSLLHERQAIDALAKLAGLDLHLASVAPSISRTRVTSHVHPCGYSIVIA